MLSDCWEFDAGEELKAKGMRARLVPGYNIVSESACIQRRVTIQLVQIVLTSNRLRSYGELSGRQAARECMSPAIQTVFDQSK